MSAHTFLSAELIAELKAEEANILLMDADIPCYSVGFSCEQESSWHLVQKTVDNFMMKAIRECNTTHVLGFMTDGAANYRNTDAVTFAYKGNRSGTSKPKWYKKIRHYLEHNWFCQTMVGIEADDALAIAQAYFIQLGINCVMATLDKDLDQCYGWKYNWKNEFKGLYFVDEEKAHYNLWKQVITGDVGTDNIPGLSHSAWKPDCETRVPVFENEMRVPREPKLLASGKYSNRKMSHPKQVGWKVVAKKDQRALQEDTYGDVTAYKLLDSWNPEDYPQKIAEEYCSAYYEEGVIQGYEDPTEYCLMRYKEVFTLVYMLRTVEEIPNDAVINFIPTKTELQILSEFDDESIDPLADFDDDF